MHSKQSGGVVVYSTDDIFTTKKSTTSKTTPKKSHFEYVTIPPAVHFYNYNDERKCRTDRSGKGGRRTVKK